MLAFCTLALFSIVRSSCCTRRSSLLVLPSAFLGRRSVFAQEPLFHCRQCSSPYSLTRSLSSSASTTIMSVKQSTFDTGYLDAKSASALDEELMLSPGFTLEQLMELAGLSVAEAVYSVLQEQNQHLSSSDKSRSDSKSQTTKHTILVVCGPGNNGGDGLVAARHLVHFGYSCEVVYPKESTKQPHYQNLVQQCKNVDISFRTDMPSVHEQVQGQQQQHYVAIVDAIFGFSFRGEPRPPFDSIIKQMIQAQDKGTVIFAVDVPSGWNVDEGDVSGLGFMPNVLISLTAPKLLAKSYPGRHFVGGRFLPPKLGEKYGIKMPSYPGAAQVMEI